MNPKIKAEELYKKMLEAGDDQGDFVYDASAKASALICVDEIIKLRCLTGSWGEGIDLPLNSTMRQYWNEVKQEIEKL